MKRNLLLSALLVFALISMAQAQQGQPSWFVRGQGGIMATVKQLEGDTKVAGVAEFGFLWLVFKDYIAIGGNYTDLNNQGENWQDYRGKVYFFTRNVKENTGKPPMLFITGLWDPKPQIYLTLGPGWTDDAKQSEGGQVSFNSGFGVLFPLWGATPFVEFAGLYSMEEWVFSLTGGLQIGLY